VSTVQKIITLLVLGAIAVLIITHPAGFASDAVAGGSVLDNTLALESGQGVTSGTSGTVNLPKGGSITNYG
jgi:hypothetical protein